ncbi:MAG: hypothetical protein L0Z62_50450 [Gemmataceae bacterium]|nr:hypothetical protein [Gemmataceae bacterium]
MPVDFRRLRRNYSMRRLPMLARRVLLAMAMPILGLLLVGCGSGGVVTTVGLAAKSASEERNLTAAHVPGSGLGVHTGVGSVEVIADPSSKEVKVTAKVTASGDTEEEAQARLQEIQVKVNRREDQVLEITAEHPQEGQNFRGGCSFVIQVPEANGSKVRTGTGSVTLRGLGGPADIQIGVGAVVVADQDGTVTAQTGSGDVRVTKAAGDVQVTASVGKVTVHEAAGTVKAKSGTGSLEVTKAGGTVEATLSIGTVTVRETAGAVTVGTGTGDVTLAQVKGAVKAKTSIGRMTLEQVSGKVEAETGTGAVNYTPASGSNAAFNLKTSIGAITVRLPGSAGGSIQASTSIGHVTVQGARSPRFVTGGRTSKQIVLTEKGPMSKVHTGSGSITITLE